MLFILMIHKVLSQKLAAGQKQRCISSVEWCTTIGDTRTPWLVPKIWSKHLILVCTFCFIKLIKLHHWNMSVNSTFPSFSIHFSVLVNQRIDQNLKLLQAWVQQNEERELYKLYTTFCFLINNAWHVAGRQMWAIHWNGYLSNDEWAVTSNCSTGLHSMTFFTASYHQSARSHWAGSEVNSRGGTKPWLIQKCSWSF